MSDKAGGDKREGLLKSLSTIGLWLLVSYAIVAYVNPQLEVSHPDFPLLHTLTWALPSVTTIAYLVMVFYAKMFRPESRTEPVWGSAPWMMQLLVLWNGGLAFLSALMWVGMTLPMMARGWELGPLNMLCDRDYAFGSADGGIVSPGMLWMCAFVFSKYAELMDTGFLVLRRKPIIFLHWYHHATVLGTTWAYMKTRFVPGIWFGMMNAAVHTLMYHYYYRAASGAKLTYPRLITTIQIVQMMSGLLITIAWTYFNHQGEDVCASPDERTLILAATYGMYGSYLLLFMSFYTQRYAAKSKAN